MRQIKDLTKTLPQRYSGPKKPQQKIASVFLAEGHGRINSASPTSLHRARRSMEYRNSEMKLDQLIGYFNDNKINLIPPFQRGHVWKLPGRRRLIQNIVNGRPIPAIFLYKEPDGSKYAYNILDGKQRLESLLLFIGSKRTDVRIPNAKGYFFSEKEKKEINFWIELPDGSKVTFSDLSEDAVRNFREYAIPTIEINMEGSSLDELISLFIDINQQGEPVTRFDMVKALAKNPLLDSVFNLIAKREKRGKDMHYQKINTVFTRVLSKLQTIQNITEANPKVDRMWERLLEITLYGRTHKHRVPAQILRGFIRSRDQEEKQALSPKEVKQLRTVFTFLANCYLKTTLGKTKLAADQTHFYTLVTTLLSSDLLKVKKGIPPNTKELQRKLLAFAKIVDEDTRPPASIKAAVADYMQKSQKQTTTLGQREGREQRLLEILDAL